MKRRLASDQGLFYGLVLVPVGAFMWLIAGVLTSGDARPPASPAEWMLLTLQLFWFTGSLCAILNLVGLLRYGSPQVSDRNNLVDFAGSGWDDRNLLLVVYVSRGENCQALERSLSSTTAALEAMRVRYGIEVVTDTPVENRIGSTRCTRFVVVPPGYRTARLSQYKARGLQYALEQRRMLTARGTDAVWLLHMDEESVLTPEAIAGIHKFIRDPANARTIGQGEIKYNGFEYGERVFMTALDNVRTGEDLGRFRCQFRMLHRPLFGMHGSFILLPAALEEEIGFDSGGRGSITEDAYFALVAADRGVRFSWVDGFIREQSPFSVDAIIRQRRRWFHGLLNVSLDPAIRFRTRWCLLISTVLWPLAPLSLLATAATAAAALQAPTYFPVPAAVCAGIVQGAAVSIYLVGAYRSVLDMPWSPARRAFITLLTLLLLPAASIVEGFAIFRALIDPPREFDVVCK
jgi:egghead protein (zeste-white 4 protein)